MNYYFSTKNIMVWGHKESEYQETVLPVSALVEAAQNSDPGFYRMEIGEQRSGNCGNDPMLYGYYGVGHGGSDDRDFVRTALNALGVHRYDMRNSYGRGIVSATDALLGLRYIISKEDLADEKGYEYRVTIDNWNLYRNPYALPVSLIANSAVMDTEIDLENVFDNLNRTWTAMTGIEDGIFTEEKNIRFSLHNVTDPISLSQNEAREIVASRDAAAQGVENIESENIENSTDESSASTEGAYENATRGTFQEEPENTNYIMFTWTAKKDGPVYSYNRSGVTEKGASLPALNYEGYHHKGDKVTGYIPVYNTLATEYLLEDVAGRFHLVYADADVVNEMSQVILNRPSTIEKITDSHLRGSFTTEAGQMLMFTIPYDEGWTLTVDGKETELEKVLDVFMAADVEPGEHTYEMTFTPSGLTAGLIASAVALLGTIMFLLLDRRKRSGANQKETNGDLNNEAEASSSNALAQNIEVLGYLEKKTFSGYTKKDWLFAGIVTFIVLLIGAGALTSGLVDWGDDHSAYISEGIAIANGKFEEQTEINYFYHPSLLPKEAVDGKLTYVWGYPLVQALVYKLVGFDYDLIVWYKVPLLLSLALTGGILVLFFRRRFSLIVAVFLSLVFCMSGDLLSRINSLYSDLPFLFLTVLSLLLTECLYEHAENGRKSIVLGIVLGVVMWLTYETRLSGITVCAVAIGGYLLSAFKKKNMGKCLQKLLIPILVAIGLVLVTEHFWLAPATSNISDFARGGNGNNVTFYFQQVLSYLASLFGLPLPILGYPLIVVCIIGIALHGIKENLHLTVLLAGTIIGCVMLPYTQGLRYLYNVLPLLLMYLAYGFRFLGGLAERIVVSLTDDASGKSAASIRKNGRFAARAALIGLMAVTCIFPISEDTANLSQWEQKSSYDVYSDYAIQVYNFIRNEVSGDKIVAFAKPRSLYLNTGHLSYRPNVNGHTLEDADYYLDTKFYFPDYPALDLSEVKKSVVFDNEMYTLYKLDI